MSLQLFKHQYEFVTDLEHRYIALRAGLGAGKTFAFCAKVLQLAAVNCEAIGDHVGIVCEPTYPLIKDVFIPTMEEVLDAIGIDTYTLNQSGGTPEFKIKFASGTSTIKMRSAENYKRLIGINAAWAGIDEMDTMDTQLQEAMWVRINGRIRAKGAIKQTFVTSTPEGHKFMNEFFVERASTKPELSGKVRVIQASTYDNPEVDEDYIKDNMANMTDEQVEAWVHGNVVNMTTGRIYRKFNRVDNGTDWTIDTVRNEWAKKKDSRGRAIALPELHIGMDFNVDKMAAIVHVILDGNPLAIDEMVDLQDTEQVIRVIQQRYPEFAVNMYPDSSGKNRSHANATSETDIQLLRKAGFAVHVDSVNPPVRDRINAMNIAFCNSEGVRKYKVNSKTCPKYVQSLERQVYDPNTGEPIKDGKTDHANDAGGYFIYRKYPIKYLKPGGLRMAGMY